MSQGESQKLQRPLRKKVQEQYLYINLWDDQYNHCFDSVQGHYRTLYLIECKKRIEQQVIFLVWMKTNSPPWMIKFPVWAIEEFFLDYRSSIHPNPALSYVLLNQPIAHAKSSQMIQTQPLQARSLSQSSIVRQRQMQECLQSKFSLYCCFSIYLWRKQHELGKAGMRVSIA